MKIKLTVLVQYNLWKYKTSNEELSLLMELKRVRVRYKVNLEVKLFIMILLEITNINYPVDIYIYRRTSLVRTPGDRQNVFALSEIRINQNHLY